MPSTRSRVLATTFSALGVVLIGGLVFSVYSALKQNQEIADYAANHIYVDAEAAVRAQLKDPTSAIFSGEHVVGTGAQQRVCGYVNAKNSFGAYTGDKRFVSFLGAVAYLGDERPIEALWVRKEHPCDVT